MTDTGTTTNAVRETSIPGLYVVDLVVHADDRGWFKENYQRERFTSLGLPQFEFVQNNVAYNNVTGILRGIHAEPWTKFSSLAHGRAFAAIVDLRAGEAFGRVETFELHPGVALLIPGGCGNSYETLEPHTVYTYLVTNYFDRSATYKAVHPFDPDLGIDWPISADAAVLSDKDRNNPHLSEITPYDDGDTLK